MPRPLDSVLPQTRSLTLGALIGAPTVREGCAQQHNFRRSETERELYAESTPGGPARPMEPRARQPDYRSLKLIGATPAFLCQPTKAGVPIR